MKVLFTIFQVRVDYGFDVREWVKFPKGIRVGSWLSPVPRHQLKKRRKGNERKR